MAGARGAGERTVGLLGIGLMGTAFAGRLLGAGFDVMGFDVDPAKGAALARMGGRAAASVAEVGRSCRRILLSVYDTSQVEAVVEGADGIIAAMGEAPGPRIVLSASTCEPERIAALAARAAPRGVTLLDTPVSGTSDQLAKGEGVGLLGGDGDALAAVDDVLAAVYPQRFRIGGAGDATRAKLAINLILGLNRAALAEGLVFAERLGLDPAAFLEVARGSAAYSQVMDKKGAKMLRRDFAAQGRVRQSLKDQTLILEAAARAGQDLPLVTVHADLLRGCIAQGEADWDNSAVVEEIRRRRRGTQGEGRQS
jgi:3-hydroxyisobutyrate dehydrogenase-like beta-hydroxyacid dehydrogenase